MKQRDGRKSKASKKKGRSLVKKDLPGEVGLQRLLTDLTQIFRRRRGRGSVQISDSPAGAVAEAPCRLQTLEREQKRGVERELGSQKCCSTLKRRVHSAWIEQEESKLVLHTGRKSTHGGEAVHQLEEARKPEHHSRPASTPPRPATSSSMQHFTYTAAIRTVSSSNSITPPTRSSSHGGGRQSSTLLKQPLAGKESAAPHKNTAAEVVFINMKIQGQFTVSREKSPNLFQQLTNLPPDGVRYEGKLVDEWKEQYDSVTARKLVCRDDAGIHSRILAGQMKVQPRILHYVLTRVLIPRATNIGQASEEDIMLLWAFLNSIHINWGHLIRYKMKRALRENAKLPYPHLITIFMEHFQVPTDTDPISELKFKQKMGSEVVASFGYVQNDDGEWVHKANGPHPPLQPGQHQEGDYDEQGSSSTTLNDVMNRIEQLQTFVGTRFNAFETRFDAFETRFGNMDMVMTTRFDALQNRVRNIEEQLQHLQSGSENNPQT
ncbi:hypothetical protein LR48_Vigan10g215900 [Vigna angularis]|uniref:Uncharacterized protein n=1 Tax=Phaseolus angularis TaxID=3914 RepID=A0A0L9VMZ0_PHAAN|nr:hypothetical protein LR48_Vigan10g215900 [Vigna angularis]